MSIDGRPLLDEPLVVDWALEDGIEAVSVLVVWLVSVTDPVAVPAGVVRPLGVTLVDLLGLTGSLVVSGGHIFLK